MLKARVFTIKAMEMKIILTGMIMVMTVITSSAQTRNGGKGPGNDCCRRYANSDSLGRPGNRNESSTTFRLNRRYIERSYGCGRRGRNCRGGADMNKNGICDYYESQITKK